MEEETKFSLAWEKKIRKKAQELVQSLESGYMELAEILYNVFDKTRGGKPTGDPLYKAWGYDTFAEYVDAELGIGVRKAQRLRYIWFRLEVELSDLDAKLKDRVIALGWSKARELVRMLTLQNAVEWIDKAEKLSFVELEEAVRQHLLWVTEEREKAEKAGDDPAEVEKGTPEQSLDPAKSFQCKLYKDQMEMVTAAMKRAAELAGKGSIHEKKGHLLTLICTDFLATNNFTTASVEDKLRYIAKIEDVLGLKFVVTDADGTDLIYGIDTLESLVKAYEAEPESADSGKAQVISTGAAS